MAKEPAARSGKTSSEDSATKAAKPAGGKKAAASGAGTKAKSTKTASTKTASTKAASTKTVAAKTGTAAKSAKKPASKDAPKTAANTASKSASAATSKSEPKPASKSGTKATSKAESKPAPKSDAKTAAKSPSKTAAKTGAKAGAKSGAKSGAGKTATSASKPWLQSYPDGVSEQMDPLKYSSLAGLIEASCKANAAKPAFTCMGADLTYGQMEEQSRAFAAYLQASGLEKGDRVAIMMPNVLQYPVALAGVLRAGMTVVNVNPLYTPRELEHQLNDSGAKAIVILENFAHTLEQVIARTKVKTTIVATMGDMLGFKGHIVNLVVRRVKKMVPAWSLPDHVSYKAAISRGEKGVFRTPDIALDDIAFLQYTGGTTGVSKGAVLTHENVLANVQQNGHWVGVAYRVRKKPEQLVHICALPLYHIFALTVNALVGIDQGSQNVLIPNPRDIPALVKEMKKYEWHFFAGLNTLFNALLQNEQFRSLDFSEVRLVMGGGMAVQKPVAERWKEVTGTNIYEGYGLSETSPVATANRFDSTEFTGTIGIPLPSTDIAIRDEDGKDLPLGEVGEICIRGPQVMAGYWNRPDETAKVMTKDGYFRSGDMGFMDKKGYVKIVDRKKDMILVSGFNVYPNEVEEVAVSHPGIVEAAAVGVPDEKSGEAVKLFVVRRDDTVTEEVVKKHCAEGLTNYKRPRIVEFRDELPKTNVGKILRRELR